MDIKKYTVAGRDTTLRTADFSGSPLVVLNNYSSNVSPIMNVLKKLECPDFNLLCVSNLKWNHDMTPWYCPPLSSKDAPFTGGADDYLKLLIFEILPEAKELIKGVPSHTCIAGYSLGGLFALYACCMCDVFDRAASISGSLWFPSFTDYILSHPMRKPPDRIYLSLGDTESKAKNPTLKTVRDNTEKIVRYYKSLGLDVTWELNRCGHFSDPAVLGKIGLVQKGAKK